MFILLKFVFIELWSHRTGVNHTKIQNNSLIQNKTIHPKNSTETFILGSGNVCFGAFNDLGFCHGASEAS